MTTNKNNPITLSIIDNYNIIFVHSGNYNYSKIFKDNLKVDLKDFNLIFEGSPDDWTFEKDFKMYVNKETSTGLDLSDFEDLPFNVLFSETTINGNEYTDTLNLLKYAKSNVIVNANEQDNTIILGAIQNNITLNLNSGTNVVNIEDINQNTFNLFGGAGIDTINLKGSVNNYSWQKDPDGNLTIINNVSKAEININSAIDEVYLSDKTNITYNGKALNITTTNAEGSQSVNIGGNGNTILLDLQPGSDTAHIDGSNNVVSIWMDTGNDNIYIYAGDHNEIIIDGFSGPRSLNLQGSELDWNLTNDVSNKCYKHNTTDTKVIINIDIDNIIFFEYGK